MNTGLFFTLIMAMMTFSMMMGMINMMGMMEMNPRVRAVRSG